MIKQSRIDKSDWRCQSCVHKTFEELRGRFRYNKETDQYSIIRSGDLAAPHFANVQFDKFDGNYELLTTSIKNTERFRIDRMVSIVLSKKSEAKDAKAAVNYLLKSFDKLTKEQCVQIINAIHRLLASSKCDNTIKVKLATELRAFIGEGTSTKEQSIKSYEQALKDGGEVDIDD